MLLCELNGMYVYSCKLKISLDSVEVICTGCNEKGQGISIHILITATSYLSPFSALIFFLFVNIVINIYK